MNLIKQLSKDRRFFGTCRDCEQDFQLSRATLFHIREPLPEEAIRKLEQLKVRISERREEIRSQKALAHRKAAITTESVNIGKVVEKIAPSFPSFMFSPRDCQALFEPIDYVIFPGLASSHKLECIVFADVKSGNARLHSMQRDIHRVIDAGKVSFTDLLKEWCANVREKNPEPDFRGPLCSARSKFG